MTPTPANRFNPFPGLRPFEAEDNPLFFGRDDQVRALLSRLARQRLLGVVGTSGSGKSSLVRAGLLPALDGGFMAAAGSSWRVAVLRPGVDPIGHLAEALHGSSAFDPAASGPMDAAEGALELATLMTETTLRRGALGLIEAVRLQRMEAGDNLLVVVDQFEELFRFKQQSDRRGAVDDAEAFVKLLLEASAQTAVQIYVVLTMRSEYLGECSQFRGLPEALNDSQVLIPRLSRDQLRLAIEAPVKVGGATISSALVNRLLNDIGDNQDQLPVLQHALMRTWEHWQARGQSSDPIGLEDYAAIGGMEMALSRHADEIYNSLAGDAQRSTAEVMFRCLTEMDSGGRGIRRPTRVREVSAVAEVPPADVIAIAEAFRAPGRTFLMPPVSEGLDASSMLDLSHESLMRVWERLKGWVAKEEASAQNYRRLAERATLHARGQAAPLRDPELTIFEIWRKDHSPNAAWAERYASDFDAALAFLHSSKVQHDAELAEEERRREADSRRELEEANRARVAAEERQRLLRRGLVGMGFLTLVAVMSSGLAFFKFQEAERNQALAYAANARASLSTDPFAAVVNGLAAMGSLANDPRESILLTDTLEQAVTRNWQVGSISTGQGVLRRLIALKNGELISGGADGSLRRWRNGKPVGDGKPIPTGQGPVMSLIELKNGELISGGWDGSLRRWKDGQAVGEPIATGQGPVLSLIELKNGELISSGEDGSLRRWKDGQAVGESIATGQGPVWKLIELKNGELISGGEDGSLWRWKDGQAVGEPIATGQGPVRSLIELKNGELISGGWDGRLRRWKDGQAVGGPIATDQGRVTSLMELKNGELISVGENGRLRRWKDGQAVGEPIATGQDVVTSLIELKNGELISVGADGILWRWKDGQAVGEPIATGQGPVRSLIELKNGEVISGGEDGSLRLWRDGQAVGGPIATDQGTVESLIELKNGELISGGWDGSLRRWKDGQAVGGPITTDQGTVESLIALKNGELISGGADGSLRRWRNGKPVGDGKPIATGQGSVMSLIALKNGELISGGADGRLRRWKDGLAVGEPIATLQGPVRSLIELKNGELISGGTDGRLRRWKDGQAVGEPIVTGQGPVWKLIELKNGELISAGRDGSLRRWKDGQAVGEPIATGQDVVTSLIALKNGELISGGWDGRLRFWGQSNRAIQSACQELREHPALLDPQTAVEQAANATCRSRGYLN